MQKNIIIVAVIFLMVALFFIFYPKYENKRARPFSQTVQSYQEYKDNLSQTALTKSDSPVTSSENSGGQQAKKIKSSFDIVRVEEDGSMVAAGKGEKGALIYLMDGDSVLAKLKVNEHGEWIFIPSEALSVGVHEIWIKDSSVSTREDSEIVVVNVSQPEQTGESLAVMMSADAKSVDILQAPAAQIKTVIDIQSVKYIDNGLIIEGSTQETGLINVYMDNLFLGNLEAKDEEWILNIPRKLEAGHKYLIRADKIDAAGKVRARVEVPFEMESGLQTEESRHVRIVKGDCLWSIAKQLYGSGHAYVTIYQANKDQIKDPNLIYPNQVFILPSTQQN